MSADLIEAMARELGETSLFATGQQLAETALSALHSAGYAVVPREPTDEMFDGFVSCNARRIEPHDERVFWEGDAGNFLASYTAMLSTSPSSSEASAETEKGS